MKILFSSTLFLSILNISSAAADSIVFIVNIENPAVNITEKRLNDYFLKREKVWPDRTPVRFIDRTESSERKVFLSSILNKSTGELDEFWIGQKLYTGDSAPVQSASDSMSIQFVSTFKGAIGYISSKTPLRSKSVKIIEVLSDQ
ncbi:MAG: hypothetical protein AB7G93_20315 [Bdellovibrionales bacterium]